MKLASGLARNATHGDVQHVTQRVNLVVAAKSPIRRIREHARGRGWTRTGTRGSRTRPMISAASRSPWLQKGATDGRSQPASWKIRLVRARRQGRQEGAGVLR